MKPTVALRENLKCPLGIYLWSHLRLGLLIALSFAPGLAVAAAGRDAPASQAGKNSRPPASLNPSSSTELAAALDSLQKEVSGEVKLTAAEISNVTALVLKDAEHIGSDLTIANQAFQVVELYETRLGPLFINAATKGGFPRSPQGGLEIHRALFAVQQALLDYAYTAPNLERHAELLNGKRFQTSEYFPGKVSPPANPDHVHEVKINASQPEAWGFPVLYQDEPARRPTGCYLARAASAR